MFIDVNFDPMFWLRRRILRRASKSTLYQMRKKASTGKEVIDMIEIYIAYLQHTAVLLCFGNP